MAECLEEWEEREFSKSSRVGFPGGVRGRGSVILYSK